MDLSLTRQSLLPTELLISKNMSKRAWDAVGVILCVLFFASVGVSVYFVTAAYTATHNGPIRWDEGARAVLELLSTD